LASDKEKYADQIIQRLKLRDSLVVYGQAPQQLGHGNQKHPRYPGDHFLSNRDLIEKSEVYSVARMMPKGAHLHIHFNSCLEPRFLLDIASQQPRMFISSNMPLPSGDGAALKQCEVQFSLLAEGEEKPGDIYDPVCYKPGQDMPFSEFLRRFPVEQQGEPLEWLEGKLMFSAEEAHNIRQTTLGQVILPKVDPLADNFRAWEKFNGRTRMMKGLFNYEDSFRLYTRAVLADFVKDNIQYAEIRPTFMASNILKASDGSVQAAGNRRTVEIIIEEYEDFQKTNTKGYFAGLKIIYCTPRSFKNKQIEDALEECLAFKKEWPTWIAGRHPPCGRRIWLGR
jgi:adenosine deaminase CECR1